MVLFPREIWASELWYNIYSKQITTDSQKIRLPRDPWKSSNYRDLSFQEIGLKQRK